MKKLEEMRAAAGSLALVRADVNEIEIREDEESGDFTFTGHAAVFDRMSEELGGRGYSFKEKIQRGAFRKALDENQDVVLLFDHEGMPLARTSANTLELREDPRGLFTYAKVAPTSLARDLKISMERGNVSQMSFAFTVAEDNWEERTAENGDVEAIRTVVKVDRLFDVSAVSQPAYPQTDAQMRSLDLERVARRFGITVPDLGDTEQLAPGMGSAEEEDREARKARHRELVAGAKRRLSLAEVS